MKTELCCPICNTKISDNSIEFCTNCNWELISISETSTDGLKKYFDCRLLNYKKMYLSQEPTNIRENDGDGIKIKDRLNKGEELEIGNSLRSDDGRFHLIMQEDGNLVLYNANNIAKWSSGTAGEQIHRCIFQDDGNLVLYNKYRKSIWHTATYNRGGLCLQLQNDGDLIILSDEKQIWHSGTSEIPNMSLGELPQCEFMISNMRYDTYLDCFKHEDIWQVQNYPDWHGNKNQRWCIKRLPNGKIIIYSPESNHCLDTYQNKDGKWLLHLWPYHGHENQQWDIVRQEDYTYKVFSVRNSLCLDAWREDGYNILQLWKSHEGLHQRWWFNPIF